LLNLSFITNVICSCTLSEHVLARSNNTLSIRGFLTGIYSCCIIYTRSLCKLGVTFSWCFSWSCDILLWKNI